MAILHMGHKCLKEITRGSKMKASRGLVRVIFHQNDRYTTEMYSMGHPYTTSVRSTYFIPEMTGAPS